MYMTVNCKGCGEPRTFSYRKPYELQKHLVKLCRSCGATKKWENPTPAMVDASSKNGLTMGKSNKDRVPTAETIHKLKVARVGRKPALGMQHTAEWKLEMSIRLTGHTVSAASRAKCSASHHARLGTVPNPNKPTVKALGYWALQVICRDDRVCQHCGFGWNGPKTLNAHHILHQAHRPDLALDLSNGITLCVPCHKTIHKTTGATRP